MIYQKTLLVEEIIVENIPIVLSRKKIKHIHLKVYPSRQVKVSVPLTMSMPRILSFINSKMAWIKQKRQGFVGRDIPATLKYKQGEQHLFFGQHYPLHITQCTKRTCVELANNQIILRTTKPSTIASRQRLLHEWYRTQLKAIIPEYIAAYEPKMGVHVKEFGIKKMKTRWGTCNPIAKRIWLNLELARHPIKCLEYIVVHEMVHLLEANHSKRFYAHMDHFMPDWKKWKGVLNCKRSE